MIWEVIRLNIHKGIMNKLLCLLLVGICLSVWSIPASAAPTPQAKEEVFKDDELMTNLLKNVIALHVDTPYAFVKSIKMPIDIENLDVAPSVVKGNTLVPLRFVAENFGAEVLWDNAASQISIKYGNSKAVLKLNSDKMTVNNKNIKMEVPPQNMNGRTMIPLRKLAEDLLNMNVGYKDGLIVLGNQQNVTNIIQDSTNTGFVNTLFVGTRSLDPEETSFKFNGTVRYVPSTESFNFLSELGNGDPNANQVFLGWDASKRFKYYKVGYPANSPQIYIYLSLDITKDKIEVASIDLSKVGTSNGFRVGDSYRAVQFFYMHSYSEKDLGNGFIEYLHPIGAGNRLTFIVNKMTNKVSGIEIRYEISNASNLSDTFDPSKIVLENQKKMLTENDALAIVRNYDNAKLKVVTDFNNNKYYAFHAYTEEAEYDHLYLVDKNTEKLFIWYTDGTIKPVNPKSTESKKITEDRAMEIIEAKVNPIIESYKRPPYIDRLDTTTINNKTYFVFEVGYTGTSHPVMFTECYVSEEGSTIMMYDFKAEKEVPFNVSLFKQYLKAALPK